MLAAIVAVDENWGIGRNGDLLINIPEDKNFQRKNKWFNRNYGKKNMGFSSKSHYQIEKTM